MKEYQTNPCVNCMPLGGQLARSWRLRTLILAGVVLGITMVWTPQARAGSVGWSSVKITKSGFDFGGEGFVAGAPTKAGYLAWDLNDGQLKPALHGHLHLKDVRDLCARMRLDYYSNTHIFLTTKYGNQVCADNDKRHEWDVNLAPYESNKIGEVKVSIEKLTAKKDWTIVGSETVKLSTVHDKVKITEDGFDFGGEAFALGAPTNSGDVAWSWSNGQVTPHLTGVLHINNAAGACARMRLEYFQEDGAQLAEKFGGKVCASDNQHHSWTVDLKPFSNGKLTKIEVSIQTLAADGNWRAIGTDTSRYVHIPATMALCSGSGGCLASQYPLGVEVK
ncbi:MAG: hypothetical protein OEY77_00850 [Nitrospira sp.]|nr:hypothetical protein [Nitrospira sp.]